MSSLRNAVQRRNHRERAQPQSRQKWGILEKHKDYALRAQDHNRKKRKIKDLREKALLRNDDEFYFGMLSTQSSNGQKIGDRGNRAMAQAEVVGLKRQDAAHLRTLLQVVRREIVKLEEEVRLLERGEDGPEIVTLRRDGKGKGQHTVFVNDEEEQKAFTAHEWFGTDERGLDRGFNRPRKVADQMEMEEDDIQDRRQHFSRKKQIAAEESARQAKRDETKRLHAQEVRAHKLELLREQEQDLVTAEQELELQRANMSNTASSGINKKGVTFKIRERKR